WRENYYVSRVLSSTGRPFSTGCLWLARQIESKVTRNGIAARLPNGQTMRIARDSGLRLSSALVLHGLGGHEPETSDSLLFFFQRSSTFIDVGANYGFYSVLAALWNPNIRVVAFEPLQPIFEGLARNVSLNNLGERVTTENLALSSHSG